MPAVKTALGAQGIGPASPGEIARVRPRRNLAARHRRWPSERAEAALPASAALAVRHAAKARGRRRRAARAGLQAGAPRAPIQLAFQTITPWHLNNCAGLAGAGVEAIVSALASL